MNVRRRQKSARVVSMVCAITMLFGVLVSFAYFSNLPRTTAVADRLATAGNAQADDEMVYQIQSLEVYPDEENKDKSVTLHGLMPEGAEASAVDVTDDYVESGRLKTMSIDGTMTENGVIAAYDITISESNLADSTEFQPIENYPITVTINDPRISVSENLEIWHVKDDGTREKVEDVTVEEGKICFEADGFSVYEIVDGPTVIASSDDWVNADSFDAIVKLGENGFFVSNQAGKHYLTGDFVPGVTNTTGRYGLTATNPTTDTAESPVPNTAARFYFEKIDGTDDQFYIFVDKDNPKYVKLSVASDKGGLSLVENEGEKSIFTLEYDSGAKAFWASASINNTKYYWNRNTKEGQKGAIAAYTNKTDSNVYKLKLWQEAPEEPYELSGKSFGLLNYSSGTYGYAMMSAVSDNKLSSQKVVTKVNPLAHSGINFVAEGTSVSMWSFNHVEKDIYTISTEANGTTKYLKVESSALSLVDEEEASEIQVIPGTGNNFKKIKLKANNRIITYSNNKFGVATNVNNNNPEAYFTLAERSALNDDDFIVYSANKVSVSDTENVTNGKSVIVYTRVWDDVKKKYDFYAVDHDGSLVPCYERGDNIMWVGSKFNTLLWDFTEYYYAGTTTPNYYYELYNSYSRKYLAPQINEGQVLSDETIGINLPGRRNEEYYTDILAWDDPYYAYAGLKADVDNGTITSTSRSNAETFYFAVMEPVVPTLTEVATVDNTQYGISMKLVDYTNKANEQDHTDQDTILGDNTIWGDHQYNAKKGILSTDMVKISENSDVKYPTTSAGESLYELYKDAKAVNHLFIESTYNASGYFEYDSCQNFATLKGKTSGDFTVYKEIGTMDSSSKPSLKHGQFMPFNDITAGKYVTNNNPENLYDALQVELSEADPRKYEKLLKVNNPDYYFGMELEAKFQQTPSGKDAWNHDMIFEFTGDDDFWLYVDDELIIDLGGIHSALAGSVNFATGDVVVEGVQTNLRDIFRNNYTSRLKAAYEAEHSGATESEINNYLNSSEVATAIDNYLAKYFDKVNGEYEKVFKDYSSHTMRIFYMERGAGASNLHMRFNLSYVTPGSVILSKEVTGSDDVDFSLVEYPYQIWYKDEEYGNYKLLTNDENHISVKYQNSVQSVSYKEHYTNPDGDVYDSVFFLTPGKSAEIAFPQNTIEYKIIECSINKDVYNAVSYNDVPVSNTADTNEKAYQDFETISDTVEHRPRVAFKNNVDPDGLRTLKIEKKLKDESGDYIDTDDSTFSFRLFLSNGVDDSTLELAYMYKYSVITPDKKLCRWDAASQSFMPTSYTDYSSLTEEQKATVTFETSTNGTIAKIPVGYEVDVYNLPVGTKFKVEEREWDNSLGYYLEGYEREAGTYNVDDGDTLNSGRVRANESPKMYIVNRRGWGIQADKIWSDKDFTTSHDPVYFAVYKVNPTTKEYTLVPGTLKQLVHPDTSVRFFLQSLDSGYSFEDYVVQEVELTNPVVNEYGVVTSYSAIKRIGEGEKTTVGSVPYGSTETEYKQYNVSYEQGTAKSLDESDDDAGEVRNDVISNTRGGGIAITLYTWDYAEKLAGGKFELKESASGKVVGIFTSDSRGRVTVLYDEDGAFVSGVEYKLTQIEAPKGYIGMQLPAYFTVTDNGDTIMSYGDDWFRVLGSDQNEGDLIAYIDVENKPYTFDAYKRENNSNGEPLAGAHFKLYEGKTSSQGTVIKDYYPMSGYEDLVTEDDGLIPGIDQTLNPGTYYLFETTAPEGYEGLDHDIVFTISKLGVIEVENAYDLGYFESKEVDNETRHAYIISVPNRKKDVTDTTLTITKTVKGTLGDRSRDFEFTFEVTGADSSTEFAWTKNGTNQATALHSGDTFTLRHDDEVVITLPVGAEVTVTETAVTGYETKFKLDDEAAEDVNAKTFTVDAETTLAVTNTMAAVVPSGVIMKVLPVVVAGVIALAVVIVLVIRGKKRNDDDDDDEEETDEE